MLFRSIAFMDDAEAGAREMARVTKPGGTVAACMWDIAGDGMTMLRIFWSAMRVADPSVERNENLAGTADGAIGEIFERAGIRDVSSGSLEVEAQHADFDDFWEPLTHGVGPAGQALAKLDAAGREAAREACREALPSEGPFSLGARAWYARGIA